MLVLSQYVEASYAGDLLADGSGAVGYLLKDRVAKVEEFLDALHRVACGATVLDPQVVAQLLAPLGASTQDAVVRFLPGQIAALSLAPVRPDAPALSPAVAFGLLCAYAAAALAIGARELARRDA